MLHSHSMNIHRLGIVIGGCLLAACSKQSEPPVPTAAVSEPAAQTQLADPNCPPQGALNYVCGVHNAEDIVRLGDSDWLIVSGMGPLGQTPAKGRIYLIDRRSRSHEEWFPGAAPSIKKDNLFGACPAALNIENFSPHGLALREQSAGKYRLYTTSHGEREAIEMFDIDATSAKPSIAWIGCVVLPEKTFANSVAMLADGGFVTTKMMDPTAPNAFAAVMSGANTGNVYEWHPRGKVTAVAGTELPGPNGIEISEDQRWLYVAAIGSGEILRFDRSTQPPTKQSIKIDVRPDNLRWTADGKLYTVGGNMQSLPQSTECASPPCPTGWSIYEIDPQSMQATRIGGADQTAALQGASTALAVGEEIWVGTYSGDRIGIMKKQ